MRFLFLLILLAGIAVGALYPWAMSNFSGHEIGTFRVYEQGRFKPVTVPLAARDAPVRVLVDLTARTERIVSQQRTVLTLTAAGAGRTALAATLQFNHSDNPRQVSPQLPDKIFRDEAGVIETVSPGAYLFTVGPGDADDIPMRAVDLVLRSGAGAQHQIDGPDRDIVGVAGANGEEIGAGADRLDHARLVAKDLVGQLRADLARIV